MRRTRKVLQWYDYSDRFRVFVVAELHQDEWLLGLVIYDKWDKTQPFAPWGLIGLNKYWGDELFALSLSILTSPDSRLRMLIFIDFLWIFGLLK